MSSQPLRIRQHGSFTIFSEDVLPDRITQALGINPDYVRVRGEVSAEPPRPRAHMWELRVDAASLDVNQILDRLIARIEPRKDALVAFLAENPGSTAGIQVVRHFGDADGEAEVVETTPEGYTKLAGQHQLLGWHLDAATISFLAEASIELGFDEYG